MHAPVFYQLDWQNETLYFIALSAVLERRVSYFKTEYCIMCNIMKYVHWFDASGFAFNAHGLQVHTHEMWDDTRCRISTGGYNVPPEEALYIDKLPAARMDFVPGHQYSYNPQMRSFVMLSFTKALHGFESSARYLWWRGRGNLVPTHIYGETNAEMAHFAERIGFTAYPHKTYDDSFLVVGRTREVLSVAKKRVRRLGGRTLRALERRVQQEAAVDGSRYEDISDDLQKRPLGLIGRLGNLILSHFTRPDGLELVDKSTSYEE